MFRYFVVIWRLSPPIPPWPTHDGGDFDPLDKILLGGGLMGGLNSGGGGFFGDASGSRGSPPAGETLEFIELVFR